MGDKATGMSIHSQNIMQGVCDNHSRDKQVYVGGVNTHIGKGNLGAGPLLQEELAGALVEEEDGEGPVEDAALRLGVEEVGSLLALRSDDVVVVVEDQDRVLEHHVVLGHGVAVPCAGGGGRRLGAALGWSRRGGLGCRCRCRCRGGGAV